MKWRALDFDDGTYGLEHRKPGGWKMVVQNQEPLKISAKAERDTILKEILIGERQRKYDSRYRTRE